MLFVEQKLLAPFEPMVGDVCRERTLRKERLLTGEGHPEQAHRCVLLQQGNLPALQSAEHQGWGGQQESAVLGMESKHRENIPPPGSLNGSVGAIPFQAMVASSHGCHMLSVITQTW